MKRVASKQKPRKRTHITERYRGFILNQRGGLRIIVALILLCNLLYASSEILVWEKHFSNAPSSSSMHIMADNGDYIIGGTLNGQWVKRLSSDGEELWGTNISYSDELRDGFLSTDNKVILGGFFRDPDSTTNYLGLMAVDATTGEELWRKKTSFSTSLLYTSFAATAEDFLVVGRSEKIMKMNHELGNIWTKNYAHLGNKFHYHDVVKTPDNGYILVGEKQKGDYVSLVTGVKLRIDSLGDSVWFDSNGETGAYSDYYSEIIPTSDNHFLVRGLNYKYTKILKMDGNGRTAWYNSFPEDSSITSIAELPNGNYLVGGYSSHYSYGHTWLKMVNRSDGEVLQTVDVDSSYKLQEITNLSVDNDNYIIASGGVSNVTGWSTTKAWVMKFKTELTLKAPVDTNLFYFGDTITIEWNSFATSNNLKIQYSTDNGTTWKSVVDNTLNDGEYRWIAPMEETEEALIKITDIADTTKSCQNDTPFKILRNLITISSPLEGSESYAGDTLLIEWSNTGYFEHACIEITKDNGITWDTLADTTENDGEFTWPIPHDYSTECKIRISDITDNSVYGIHETPFTIAEPFLQFVNPLLDTTFVYGDTVDLSWEVFGLFDSVAYVQVDYSADSGTTWDSLAYKYVYTASCEWVIPTVETDKGLIRIKNRGMKEYVVISPRFNIRKNDISISNPKDNGTYHTGDALEITWSNTGHFSRAKIEYSSTGGISWETVAENTNNSGAYSWVVPSKGTEHGIIRISDATDANVVAQNSAPFTIIGSEVNFTTSWKDRVLYTDSSYTVTWDVSGEVTGIRVAYSMNNGATWTDIKTVDPSSSSLTWTVPSSESKTVKLKLTDSGDSDVFSISESFVITNKPTLDLLSPTTSSEWEVGVPATVSWSSTGAINTVRITLKGSSTYNWTVPDTGKYIVNVPNNMEGNAKIFISATDTLENKTYGDSTTSNFPIIAHRSLQVLTPNSGSEKWAVGSLQNISWSNTGEIASVNFYYSSDSGVNWKTIELGVSNDVKQYNWTIPDDASTKCLVKVTHASIDRIADVSDKPFTIEGGSVQIIHDPENVTVHVGDKAEFSVVATGMATISYQWQKEGVTIVGANEATYTIPAVANADGGNYRCIATNPGGSDTSTTALLTVLSDALTFTTAHPQSMKEDTSLNLAVSMTDAQGEGALVLVVGLGDHYSVNGSAITPDLNFNGTLTVPLHVTNGIETVGPVSMTVVVTPVNDVPVVINKPEDIEVTINKHFEVNFQSVFSDIDGDDLTLKVRLSNGDLMPQWLQFTDTWLRGTPTELGSYDIDLVAYDATDSIVTTCNLLVKPGTKIIDLEEEHARIQTLTVAPNPISIREDKIMIFMPSYLKGEGTVRIFDILGNEMDMQKVSLSGNNVLCWDLCNKAGQKVSSGSYLVVLQIVTENGMTLVEKNKIGITN